MDAWGPGSRWKPIVAAPADDRKLLRLGEGAIIHGMTGVAHELEPQAVEALAEAAGRLLEEDVPGRALAELAEAAAAAVGADLAIVRTISSSADELVTRAVHAGSSAVAAELEGTRLPGAAVPDGESDLSQEGLPEPFRKGCRGVGESSR